MSRLGLIVVLVALGPESVAADIVARRDANGVPVIMVPEEEQRPDAALRKVTKPRKAQVPSSPSPQTVTVPSPTVPGARLPVPDVARPGESFGDRAARCGHYGTLYGVPQGQMGAYVHNCAN